MGFKVIRSSFVIFIFIFIALLVIPGLTSADEIRGSGPQIEPSSGWDKFLDLWGKPISIYRDDVKIRIGGEFRYRMELRDNFNFNDATYEDDALNLFRSRLNMDITAGAYLRIFVEAQDAEGFASSALHRTPAFVNRFDLRQLYAEVKSPIKSVPISIKVGRQELGYGDERFVGAFNWSNVARVFDAVKLVYLPLNWFRADIWASPKLF